MKEINEAEFKKEIQDHKGTAIIDYWAPWCGPCKMLAPAFEKIASEHKKTKFLKINIDNNQNLASEQEVMSIPCIIIYKDGKEADRVVGFSGEEQLKAKLAKHCE